MKKSYRFLDKTGLSTPLDIIGDVHGCFEELSELLEKLGYRETENGYVHPDGRTCVFVGDLTDRGPASMPCMKLVMKTVKAGNAYYVIGNHDDKLRRYLQGNPVKLMRGLETTAAEFEKETKAFCEEVRRFLEELPLYITFDKGKLLVVHAGIKEEMIGRTGERVRTFCLYGDIDGSTDEYGYPVRADWAASYQGKPFVVFGHSPVREARRYENALNIDTGCVFGGKLSAYRYPEKEITEVPARRKYAEHKDFPDEEE
ncbi:MAG: metallophosphoesterase [Erysipelotrichales bacterium]|nr:metallophosphoesterase [Erysipelotrichales bacterium]